MNDNLFKLVKNINDIPVDKKLYPGNWLVRIFNYINKNESRYSLYKLNILVPHYSFCDIDVPVFAIRNDQKTLYTYNGKFFETKFNRISWNICLHKDISNQLFRQLNIPTQNITVFNNINNLNDFYSNYDFKKKLVVKPTNENNGINIFLNIDNYGDLIKYSKIILNKYAKIQVEEMIEHNFDFRILSLGGKFYAGIKRIKANVIGDGILNIKQLIEKKNLNKDNKIVIDDIIIKCLSQQKLGLNFVLPKNEIIYLKNVANFGQGGDFENITNLVGNEIKSVVKKVCNFMQLPVIGFDFFSENISANLVEGKTMLSEANGLPGMSMIYEIEGDKFVKNYLDSYFEYC